jgi:hypothetical protein
MGTRVKKRMIQHHLTTTPSEAFRAKYGYPFFLSPGVGFIIERILVASVLK